MKENTLHFLSLIIFLTIISFLVYSSCLSVLMQTQENSVLAQNFLINKQIYQALKIKKDAAEKIYLLGKFNPAIEMNFSVVPENFSVSGYTMYLRNETLNAFTEMRNAALQDGVDLKIASATRNFDYQEDIWNNKWEALPKSMDGLTRFKKILEYSAVPGTSRHHWGSEIDFNNANPQYFDTNVGEKMYDWMTKNAANFGFCQTYTAKGTDRTTGYNEEKWHWSYTPLSKKFTEDYAKLITADDIKGFDGDQYVSQFNLINDYVLGINPACLQ